MGDGSLQVISDQIAPTRTIRTQTGAVECDEICIRDRPHPTQIACNLYILRRAKPDLRYVTHDISISTHLSRLTMSYFVTLFKVDPCYR